MRFFGKITLLGFDSKTYNQEVRAAAYDTLLLAANYFLEDAAPNVPIDTGMARGSFLNLVQLLRSKGYSPNVDIPDTPQRLLKDGRPLKYVHPDGRVFPKTPDSARQLSTKPTSIIKTLNSNMTFSFTYETRVRHFNIWERKWYGSWNSFKRGGEVFRNFIKSQRINPLNYILTTTTSLGSQAHSSFTKFSNKTKDIINA